MEEMFPDEDNPFPQDPFASQQPTPKNNQQTQPPVPPPQPGNAIPATDLSKAKTNSQQPSSPPPTGPPSSQLLRAQNPNVP